MNRVSDYTYSLSRKNLRGEHLTEEELTTIKNLYEYSIQLTNELVYMQREDINWRELTRSIDIPFAQQVDNRP